MRRNNSYFYSKLQGMGARKGNKTAEKWTEREVIAMLKKIEAEAKKPSCIWLGSALSKMDLYKEIWSYWKEKFADNPNVLALMSSIELDFNKKPKTRKGRYVAKNIKRDYKKISKSNSLKYKSCPNFRIKTSFQTLMNYHLRKVKKQERSASRVMSDTLGYGVDELRSRLEQTFKDGMSWDNYGQFWQVDHIKPVSWFNLLDDSDFMQCWRLDNLKAEYKAANLSKGNRFSENPQMQIFFYENKA